MALSLAGPKDARTAKEDPLSREQETTHAAIRRPPFMQRKTPPKRGLPLVAADG
jgi:hypothetical protein